ncbi:Putative carboxypeptidase YodJ [Neobacillus rhizosphaerae]|uniref:Carboxypeptidase YodJ n=1 Tax=Neobacillus rhizosphaerae TaxID=2880965 RepID=A0ABN8KNP4_9BACI|nr:M15 family metallopeptidase [Neobacillus rhizosphaerae]CAH2714167.1 Putative carboxypeptidase YodJ [Neobacillus rhizosphaerae]
MAKFRSIILCSIALMIPLAGCSGKNNFVQNDKKMVTQSPPSANKPSADTKNVKYRQNGTSIQVVSNPETVPVLINKLNKLPDDYKPNDLTYPNIPFTFKEKIEKRKMRAIAAAAIEKLFAGAKQDGVNLLGVSAYRSHAVQTSLFNSYVKRDGYEAAKTYSAVPGTSEHETGLAIDVTGEDGKCAAEECFSGTEEAAWLQDHVAEYGFIIRYPKGKDAITGYTYEPWHLRYVGKSIAKEIMSRGITLEEYVNAAPVNN